MGMVVGKCTSDTHLFISFTSNVHIFRMMIMIGGSRRRGRVCPSCCKPGVTVLHICIARGLE